VRSTKVPLAAAMI